MFVLVASLFVFYLFKSILFRIIRFSRASLNKLRWTPKYLWCWIVLSVASNLLRFDILLYALIYKLKALYNCLHWMTFAISLISIHRLFRSFCKADASLTLLHYVAAGEFVSASKLKFWRRSCEAVRLTGRKRFLIAPSTLACPLVTQAMKLLTTP